jgi:outer membrane receptor for monomeric catechols
MNDDDHADTIAIATFDGQVTLSATIGSDDPDRLLSAMTALLGEAVAPRLASVRLFIDNNRDNRDDPIMLTRFGVAVSSQQADLPMPPMP